MNDDVVFREVTRKDIPALVDLVNSIYDIKKNYDFFVWQCFESVFHVALMGVFQGERLLGFFGIQKRELTNNAVCGQASWLNMSPQIRGKGFFQRLGELAINYFDDLDALFVFANKYAKEPCEHSFGFRTISTIKMMVYTPQENSDSCGTKWQPVNLQTSFPEISNKPQDVFMFKAPPKYRLWRYAKNPIYSYYVVSLNSGEYAIAKIFCDPVSGKKYGDIVDFECDLDDRDKLMMLFRGACHFLRKEKAIKVTTWATQGTVLRSVTEEIGFLESGHECFFGVKVLNPNYERLYDISGWRLVQADATNY